MKLNSAILALTFTALVPALSHAQTVLVSDSFALNGDDRTAGATLSGTSPEVGLGTYGKIDGEDSVFATGGGLIATYDAVTSADDVGGSISLTAPTGQVLTYSLTFNFGGDGGAGAYQYIAFNNGGSPYGALGAYLTTTGAVGVFANGAGTSLGGGQAANFNPEANNTLELIYDPTTNTASVDVNGVQVFAPTSTTAFTTAGVDFFTAYADNVPALKVTNLNVEAVPEPSSTAMIAAGGLLLAVITLRKRNTV